FSTVAQDLPKAEDGLTGDFKRDYDKLIKDVIIPGAQDKQLKTQVQVRASAVVSATPDRATVLLFLNQLTAGKDSPQASVAGSRVRMELQKVDGRWLTSALTPI